VLAMLSNQTQSQDAALQKNPHVKH